MKVKYYTLDKIKEKNADYNIIYGERSNGKTTAVLGEGLRRHIESDYVEQLAIIRRWEEDFKGAKGQAIFDAIVNLGWVEEWTKGRYNAVYYYGQRWYLAKYDETGKREYQAEEPFAIAFAISSEEHYKSTSYPNIKTILYDEFITRSYYLPDEFIKFQNLLSTIIRLRSDVKIYMCGNTVNKYCPYFNEMGLTHIKFQKQGTIDVYTYGDSGLTVAVEYSDFPSKKKASNKYFAFNNPKLQMIQNGAWEISIYPHLPYKYNRTDIIYKYYIVFDGEMLQCEVIYNRDDDLVFTFIHRKTTPIVDDNMSIVFQQEISAKPNYRRLINKTFDNIGKKIYSFYLTEKVFYQDNEVGEIVRNYINWCKKECVN